MKTLLILRHAKSSWSDGGLPDHDRPLNQRGNTDAPRMGRLLRREGLTPELIISSTAERAVATAELVAQASGYENEIRTTRSLYHAGPEAYLEQLRRLPDEYGRVMVVGHNPGIEELVEQLTSAAEMMPTAALAHVELPIEQWLALDETTEGRLIQLWLPRQLDRDV